MSRKAISVVLTVLLLSASSLASACDLSCWMAADVGHAGPRLHSTVQSSERGGHRHHMVGERCEGQDARTHASHTSLECAGCRACPHSSFVMKATSAGADKVVDLAYLIPVVAQSSSSGCGTTHRKQATYSSFQAPTRSFNLRI